MEKEIKEEKVPWALLIFLIVAISALSTLASAFLPGVWAVGFAPGPSANTMPFWNGAFLVLLLFAFITRYYKSKLNLRTFSYVFAAVIVAQPFACYAYPWVQFSGLVGARFEPLHDPFLPPWWMPTGEALETLLAGGPIDWPAWLPVLVNWVAFAIIPFLMMFSTATLFRRQWVEVEDLPFPFAAAGLSLVEYGAESERPSSKVFLASFAVFFLVFLTFPLHMAFPWVPDVLGWTYDPPFYTWNTGTLAMTHVYPALAPIVGMMSLNLNPVWFALFYFCPLDILFSMWFFWILLGFVVPQIAYTLGYYTGITSEIGQWTRFGRFILEEPMKLNAFGFYGILPGIVVSLIWLNRRYLGSTLRLAFGKASEAERSMERNSVTYRVIWLFLVVSIVLQIAFFMTMGMGPGIALMSTALWFFYLLVWARVHSVVGAVPTYRQTLFGWFKFIWPTMTVEARTQEYVMATTFNSYIAPTGDDSMQINTYAANALDAYGFGHLAKANVKKLFQIMLLAAIIAPVVTMLTLTAASYSFGFAKLPFPHEWDLMVFSDPDTYAAYPAEEPYWPHAIVGFIFALVLVFLRTRFIWWQLEPIGALMACSDLLLWGTTFMALIAWIFKYLIFKTGGVEYHRRFGVPIVTGIIAGWLIAGVLIGSTIGVLKFFFPT